MFSINSPKKSESKICIDTCRTEGLEPPDASVPQPDTTEATPSNFVPRV